jgi:osomolarity two-component system, response regulator SKN7
VMAQQQQIQHLTDRNNQLAVDHGLMVQELMRVQKTVLNHENVIHQVMNFLLTLDARQRRDGRAAGPYQTSVTEGTALNSSQVPAMDDLPASPLQQASKLLNNMNAEVQFTLANMDSVNDPQKNTGIVSTSPLDSTGRNGSTRSVASTAPGLYGKINGVDMASVGVYPGGSSNGIDPMYSEHVQNVPYPLPTKDLDPSDLRRQYADGRRKTGQMDPGWVRGPHILLVEDDQTCRQIGTKFLTSFSCVIETAVSINVENPSISKEKGNKPKKGGGSGNSEEEKH